MVKIHVTFVKKPGILPATVHPLQVKSLMLRDQESSKTYYNLFSTKTSSSRELHKRAYASFALRRKDTCYFCKKDGHTSVVEIDSRDPTRVRTDTCPGNFWKVLEICTRHSTSMISNDTQSQSDHSISQSY